MSWSLFCLSDSIFVSVLWWTYCTVSGLCCDQQQLLTASAGSKDEFMKVMSQTLWLIETSRGVPQGTLWFVYYDECCLPRNSRFSVEALFQHYNITHMPPLFTLKRLKRTTPLDRYALTFSQCSTSDERSESEEGRWRTQLKVTYIELKH